MIQLISEENARKIYITSILPRLKVWKFMGTWDEEREIPENFFKNCMNA